MGFHQSQTTNRIYAKISNGKIVLSSKEPREGYTERVNKAGNTVYEQAHDAFTGYLVNVEAHDGDFGKQWLFTMRDAPEEPQVVIQTFFDSSYGKGFVNCLLNPELDLTEKFTVKPYAYEKDGKNKTGVGIKQRGNDIRWQYTKDNGLPAMTKIKVKGQEQWDSSDVLEFFEQKIQTEILDRIDAKTPEPAIADSGADDGSLPF